MTKQEILTKRQFLDKHDIMQIFECGRSKAEGIIRSIKSVSDKLMIKGKVTVSDYNAWYGLYGSKQYGQSGQNKSVQ
ncbi:MAG: hypothetical protein NC350_03870 [Corallococcus sp.]|nr:hypothetical protein [Corallococcus sp.]